MSAARERSGQDGVSGQRRVSERRVCSLLPGPAEAAALRLQRYRQEHTLNLRPKHTVTGTVHSVSLVKELSSPPLLLLMI